MSGNTIHGVVAYPITPFRDDHTIDDAALSSLVDRLVTGGAHAIAPAGSTGELAYLDGAEYERVIETTIAAVDGRVPVIAGASDLSTRGTVSRATRARELGVDAVMILPVSYWRLTDAEVFTHYQAVSDGVGLPIMAYNNPATSGIDMSPELLVDMYDRIDNVTMVKESTGDISRMHRLTELTDGRLPFFNGSNPLVLEAFRAGATGWCTAAPCLRPAECLALVEAAESGDFDTAAKVYDDLRTLLEFIVSRGLPTTVKAGLDLLGVGVGNPRPPLLPLETDQRNVLGELLEI